MKKDFSIKAESKYLADLLELATGYQRSKTLFTFAEFEIPSMLEKKALTAKQIAKKLKINSLAADRFLNACVALKLLKKSGDLFSNTKISEIFLVKSADFFLGGQMKRYSERSYPVWSDLTEKLKKWEYGETSKANPDEEDQGAKAMAEQHNLSLLHGFALAESFDFSKYKKVLDLGGGTGSMVIALCTKYPKLRAIVYDLPENVKTAKKFVSKEKLTERIECVGADFQKDGLPDGFDFALLANFMSVADKENNVEILAEIYKKLPQNGACMLSGMIMDNSRLAPQTAALFCLEDICQSAPDVERTEKIYTNWLKNAGFKKVKCKTYLEPTKMLYGYK